MSIRSTTLGINSSLSSDILKERMKPQDMTKDDLTKLEAQLKAQGKDTSAVDEILDGFDKLDTDGDGKVSVDTFKLQMSQAPYGMTSSKEMSLDDLKALKEKLAAQDKDTSTLDTMIANFDVLDTDKSGKVSLSELKKNAQQLGITLPQDSSTTTTQDTLQSIQMGGVPLYSSLISSDSSSGSWADQLIQSFTQNTNAANQALLSSLNLLG